MAELVFRPPNAVLFLALGIVAIGVISMFLKKGETGRKVTSLVIVVAIAGGLLLFLYRSTTLTVDAEGVRASGTRGVELSWDDVDRVILERDLAASEYRPSVRTRGTAIGAYRVGRFSLRNGTAAQVLMERTDQAAVLVADELTYVFAPAEIDVLFEALSRHAPEKVQAR